jgi:hypothetical protein
MATATFEKPANHADLDDNCSDEKTPVYFSLAPKADLNKDEDNRFKYYYEHLSSVFANPELRNIALIGKRGAGKSSIIRSFDTTKQTSSEATDQQNSNNRKFLYISLTDFSDADNSVTVDASDIRKKLEYSLLCQVLSRCDEYDLRNSSIKGIPLDQRKLRPIRYTWFCVTMLLVMGLVFENRFGALLASFGVPTIWRIRLHAFGYVVAFILLVGGFLYYRRKQPESMKLKRLFFKVSNIEAEVVPSNECYCLDQYRFEIVHILDQIAEKIDRTVVIEDMERCGNPDVARQIMTRLRELNALVNTHRKSKHQAINSKDDYTPIRFMYALSDDLLGYEERTKFFDTIIPVIPFVNKMNSCERLKAELKSYSIVPTEKFEALLDQLSPHLTDYRLMRNILTEYFLLRGYCKMVGPQHLAASNSDVESRIFAVAVYKCLFPREYQESITDSKSEEFSVPGRKKAKDLYNLSRIFSEPIDPNNPALGKWLDKKTFELILQSNNTQISSQ